MGGSRLGLVFDFAHGDFIEVRLVVRADDGRGVVGAEEMLESVDGLVGAPFVLWTSGANQ